MIVNQAVLLAPVRRSPAPSQGSSPSGIRGNTTRISMRVRSLSQWRDRSGFIGNIPFTGFSIKHSYLTQCYKVFVKYSDKDSIG